MNSFLSLPIILTGMITAIWLILSVVSNERKKNKYSPFTEKSLRSPGYSLGLQLDEALANFMEPLLGLIITPIVYFMILGQIALSSAIIFAIPALVLMIIFGRKFISHATKARSIRLGLEGEVYTGQELNYLMHEGAYVYHDLPYRYGNIDHVVISTGGVFVIETKAVRKPAGEDGKRQSKVVCKNGELRFPHFKTDYPVRQALRHAEYMRAFLKKRTGENISVKAVVALPGWFIESTGTEMDLLTINPKRGKALRSFVVRNKISEKTAEITANLIEEIARSVFSKTEVFDPDGDKKFGFWLDRNPEDRKIE